MGRSEVPFASACLQRLHSRGEPENVPVSERQQCWTRQLRFLKARRKNVQDTAARAGSSQKSLPASAPLPAHNWQWFRRSGAVQRERCSLPQPHKDKIMLVLGWLTVLLGVFALLWADGA